MTGIWRSLPPWTSGIAPPPRKSSGILPPRPVRPGSALPPPATPVGRLLANSSRAYFPPQNCSGCARPEHTSTEPGPHPVPAPLLPHCARFDESSAGLGPVFTVCLLWTEVMFMSMSKIHLLTARQNRVLAALSHPSPRRSASRAERTSPFRHTSDTGDKETGRTGARNPPLRHGRKVHVHERRIAFFTLNLTADSPPKTTPTSARPCRPFPAHAIDAVRAATYLPPSKRFDVPRRIGSTRLASTIASLHPAP